VRGSVLSWPAAQLSKLLAEPWTIVIKTWSHRRAHRENILKINLLRRAQRVPGNM